jgi:hypothetical protein
VLLPNGNDCWIEENEWPFSRPIARVGQWWRRRLNARKAKSPQDGLPTQQRKTPWIYAEKTELGTDLFPPATALFCKIGSASASKTPQRSRSGIYLTFSTTESTAFTGCTEGTARIRSGKQRHATSGRNQCGFVCKKSSEPSPRPSTQRGRGRKSSCSRPITLALERIAGSGLAPITWFSGDTTVVLVEACAGAGWASCARCFAGTGVDTSAAIPTTDSTAFRFEFIINLTWLHHPCDANSAYAVAHMPPSHHGFCVAKILRVIRS